MQCQVLSASWKNIFIQYIYFNACKNIWGRHGALIELEYLSTNYSLRRNSLLRPILCKTNYLKDQVYFFGPKIWNDLPLNLLTNNLSLFKKNWLRNSYWFNITNTKYFQFNLPLVYFFLISFLCVFVRVFIGFYVYYLFFI